MDHYYAYVNNKWIDADDRIEVENPSTGEVFATVPKCTGAQAVDALEAAKAAQPAWQALPPVERANHLYALARGIEERAEHFARLLVQEQGKTLEEAAGEVTDTVRYITYSAEAARRIRGDIFPADAPNEQLFIYRVPFGVTVGLCAYNYPLALIGRKVGPALVTGNTIVLKPHEATPVTASVFCEVVEAAGLPAGVVNMLTGTGDDVGSVLVESPLTRLITLTGSIRAGGIVKGTGLEAANPGV